MGVKPKHESLAGEVVIPLKAAAQMVFSGPRLAAATWRRTINQVPEIRQRAERGSLVRFVPSLRVPHTHTRVQFVPNVIHFVRSYYPFVDYRL